MIPKFSVKKPLTVAVAVIMFFILGFVSFMNLKTDLLPSIDLPYALVLTQYPGANPEKVEMTVTKPIEQVVATVGGVKNVSSTSSENASIVMLEFEQNINMDSAILDVNSKLDLVKSSFDEGVGSTSVMKLNPDSMPIMMLSVDIEDMDIKELSTYVSNNIVPEIERINGVASVDVTGLIEDKIEVKLINEKISSVNNKVQSKVESELSNAEQELNNAQTEISNAQSNLEKQGQSQRESLIKAEVELQSAKIKLENVASSLASQGLDKDKLNTIINETSKALDTAKLQLGELKKELESVSQEDAESIIGIQAQISILNTTISKLEETIKSAQQGLEALQALDNIKSQETQLKLAQVKMSEELIKASVELSSGEADLKKAKEELELKREEAIKSSDIRSTITVDMISNILMAQNFSMPAGYITAKDDKYLVKVGDKFNSIEELENLLLFDIKGVGKIYLKDVAQINKIDNSDETYANVNGNNGVMISLQKSSIASTTEVTDEVNNTINKIMEKDSTINITPLMDQGIYIDMIIDSVLDNLIVGGFLAAVVLFIFLKSIRSTMIIALSMPISVLISLTLMYFTDINLNIISLSGLSLGIGMIIDNSLIVLDMIYKLRSEGMSLAKACVQGARNVSGAIFASTLTTICVFFPIVFADGLTKSLFSDMALTIGYSLTASLIVALTVIPAMSYKMLKKINDNPGKIYNKLVSLYEKSLKWSLSHKIFIILPAVGLLLFSGYKVTTMGMVFMPSMDSTQMSATLTMPNGSSKNDTIKMSDEIINRLIKIDAIDTIGATSLGSPMSGQAAEDTMSFYIILKEDKTLSNTDVEKLIIEKTKDLDCKLSVSTSNMDMSALGGSGIQVTVKGNDLDKLKEISNDLSEKISEVEGITEVTKGTSDTGVETRIIIDKNKAMEYGLTIAQIYQKIASDIQSEKSSTTLTIDNSDYPVIVTREDILTKEELKEYTLPGTKDNETVEVSLDEISKQEDTESLSSITRDNQTRYLTVSAKVDSSHNISLVGRDVEAIVKDYKVPEGYHLQIGGEIENIKDTLADLILMITLAIVFVYLVMVAQFQSLLSPFIVMFTIPLAFTGGILAMLITGNDISIVSMLGFLVLSGIVVNNGIVFIDNINQLRLSGVDKKEAIMETGRTRIRPILMTALTTILAMSTMAFSTGMGAEMTQGLAIVTIGGLTYSTILTLFVVPILYDLLNRKDIRGIDVD